MKKILCSTLTAVGCLFALPAMADDASIADYVRKVIEVPGEDAAMTAELLKKDKFLARAARLYCDFRENGYSMFDAVWAVATVPEARSANVSPEYEERFNRIEKLIAKHSVEYAITEKCKL